MNLAAENADTQTGGYGRRRLVGAWTCSFLGVRDRTLPSILSTFLTYHEVKYEWETKRPMRTYEFGVDRSAEKIQQQIVSFRKKIIFRTNITNKKVRTTRSQWGTYIWEVCFY